MNYSSMIAIASVIFLISTGVVYAQESETIMIQFDKDVYTWTDKVKITIIAHDYNKSSNVADVIGESNTVISVSTKNHFVTDYLMHETGPDTGVFSRTITLSGFPHDADGNSNTGDSDGNDVVGTDRVSDGAAIGEYLTSDDDDIITVRLTTVEGDMEKNSIESSVPVTWNMGKVEWTKTSYLPKEGGIVTVTDPDMNLNPDRIDVFSIDVWSDSDASGIALRVTETDDATGIFKGTVFFTTTDESSGHRLRVYLGDTITAEYEDNTLPNPYGPADEFDIISKSKIREILPPLKQQISGILPGDVTCEEGLEKIFRYDGSVVCVKPLTAEELIYRGWTKTQKINDEPGLVDSTDNLDDFVFTFYSKIAEEDEKLNIFFSPLSISTAFSIAYEGARENTASEMQQVFGFEQDDTERREKISDTLSRLNHKDNWYNLQVANALWIKDGYDVKQDYIDAAKIHYSSTVDNVDFVTDDGVNKINDWVQEKTNNKIQDILVPGSTDEMTRMVITNAVYFKGKWGLEFNPKNTSEQPFWTDKDIFVMVPMMKENAAIYNYAEINNLQALELNYLGGDISMIILLPKEKQGLGELEQFLDREKFASIKDSMTRQPLTVQIPKFEFETEYDLITPLKNLGLRDAFDRNTADFQGITDEQIYLEKAAHKAFVNVNEEGTEAAAITALVARATSGPPEPVAEFVVDHPFVFVIQEKDTGEILFLGRLVNP